MTKQTIIASAIIAGTAIVSPVVGFSISPVREALLGLTPEDQILHIADTIEENRIKSSDEIATMKATIEEQKSTIEKQNAEMEAVKAETSALKQKSMETQEVADYRNDPIIKKEREENEEQARKNKEEAKKQDEKIKKIESDYRKMREAHEAELPEDLKD